MSAAPSRYRLAALSGLCLTAALAGVMPAGPPDKSQTPRKRLSIAEFVKDEKRLASLRKGVAKMRALPSTDPRSWIFQANIHWRPLFPAYAYEQAAKSKDAGRQLFHEDTGFTPDPNVFNQCPHGNWWFLPWHRAYLHYFERILRWAAEDPELMLPYWNYCDANQRELPAAFRAAKVNGKDNPLYLPESVTFTDAQGKPQVFPMRDGPLLRGDTQLSGSVGSLNALAAVPFSTAKPLPGNLGFGSPQACDGTCSCGFGALESVPHNRVHTAVGGSAAQAGGSVRVGFMGDTPTAARDPVFWVHHANIDRLWASWLSWKQGRANPTDPEWLQASFTFYDVDDKGKASAVDITVDKLLTTEKLGYVYDRLEALPATVVRAAPLPALQPGGAEFKALAATESPAPPAVKGHKDMPAAGSIQLSTTRSKAVTVRAAEGIARDTLAKLLAPAPDGPPGLAVLSLEGIEFDHLPGVDYEVYVNLPEKAKANPDNPHYAGTLTFFGLGHQAKEGHGGGRRPRYVKLAFPAGLRKLLADNPKDFTELRVTFVPQTGTEPARAGVRVPGPAERVAVTIRQIRVLQVR